MSTVNLSNHQNWLVLQDGRMGTDNQSLGLAEAMGIPYQLHSIALPWWQRMLPRKFVNKYIAPSVFRTVNSVPAGIIGSGRRASYALLAARRIWPDVRTIQIQNPKMDTSLFTHVIAPQHDALEGDNVIATLGGLHAVTDEKLSAAKAGWQERLNGFSYPRAAVLIGGNNKYVKVDADWIDDLIAKLHALYKAGYALWITVSRRTPPELIKRLELGLPKKNVFFWNGYGDNPYQAFLAMADVILVTADSVSMISESLFTDKPVALLRMPGEGKKFRRFYDALIAGGYTHWFDGSWKITNRSRLRETERAAQEIVKKS